MFVALLGFVSNPGAAHSRWRGAQTGGVSPQATPAQTTDKNAAEIKSPEILKELLILARKRAEEYKVNSFVTGRLISDFGTFQRFTVSSSEEEKKTIIKDKPRSSNLNDKKPEL